MPSDPADFDLDFLKSLLTAVGPSSFESRPAAVWQAQAEAYGAEVGRDAYGNVFARFGPGPGRVPGTHPGPRVMLAGHIDEIGLIVTYVDDVGLLYIQEVGSWDAHQLVGQRVRVLGHAGEIVGVIGRKPVHLMKSDERKKPVELADLWIDIGATSKAEALAHVRPGDTAVIEQPVVELLGGRLVSRALDNRIGAFVVLEAAKRASAAGTSAQVIAVATVQEEIGGVGAAIATYALEPDVALAVDVAHATDLPGIEAKIYGETRLGSGPELSIGSYVHRGVLARLVATAEREGIGYTVAVTPGRTYTDADFMAKNRSGVPTAVVSIPNRYMHSPNEMIDPGDIEQVVRLIAAFIGDLEPGVDLVQP